MKERAFAVRKIFLILTMVFAAAIMTLPAAADISKWEVHHYRSDGNPVENYYLTADVSGVANYEDGTTAAAFIRLYVDNGLLTFCLGPSYETRLVNKGETTAPNSIWFSTNMGLEGMTTIFMEPGSDEVYFDPQATIGGMSVNDVLLQDMRTYGCLTFRIPMNSFAGKDMKCILDFYMPFYSSEFRDLYAQAQADGWKQPVETESQTESQAQVELQSIEEEINKINVELTVNYKANELFSIYDADMYVDGELVKTFSQGTSSRVTLKVKRGEEHTVSFYKHGDKSLHDGNRHIFTFTLGRDGEIECSIAAHWYGMLVKETRLK